MTTPVKSKAKKPKRYVYTLTLPVKNKHGEKERLLKVNGLIVSIFSGYSAREVMEMVADWLKVMADDWGQHSELQVQRKDGTFATKNTYPRSSDPSPKKGSERNRG